MSEYKLVINEAPEDIVDVDTNASAQQEQKKKRRILSVDIIRSWCLLCMVFDHAIVYLSYKARPDGRLIESYDILDFLGMNLAPSFLFLSGASTTLSSKSKIPFVQGLWRALVRFLFLFACEAILTAFCVSLDNMFDILSCMAFSALVTFFCSYLTPSGMMTASYVMIYLAPIFRYLLDYSKHFSVNDQMFMVDTKKPAWVFFAGWLEGGYFPIFPWCGFAVQGVAVGTLLYHPQKRDIPAVVNFIVRHALVGSTLLGGYYLMGSPKGIPEAPENAWTGHFYMYPATPTFCFLMSAISISVLLLCNLCFDEGRFDDKWIVRQAHPDKLVGHIMNIVSRESLFVYMFQAAVYYIVMAAANDSDPVDIPLYFGFLSAAGILIFLFVVLHFWEKVNFKFSPTWALSKITAYKKNIGTDKSLDENNDKRLSLTCL